MRLLLDTHIFLWYIEGSAQLTTSTKNSIENANEVYVSSVSIWEAAIKMALKKLDVNIHELVEAIPQSGFLELPLTIKHAAATAQLPLLHRDPFDRILIAQAISEPLKLLTADKQLSAYSELIEVI